MIFRNGKAVVGIEEWEEMSCQYKELEEKYNNMNNECNKMDDKITQLKEALDILVNIVESTHNTLNLEVFKKLITE